MRKNKDTSVTLTIFSVGFVSLAGVIVFSIYLYSHFSEPQVEFVVIDEKEVCDSHRFVNTARGARSLGEEGYIYEKSVDGYQLMTKNVPCDGLGNPVE